jgi:hypothetical protein
VNSTHLRTAEIEQLVELVKQHYHLRLQLSPRPRSEKKRLKEMRQERIRRLHRHVKPAARPWAAREAVQILAEMQGEIAQLTGLSHVSQRFQRLAQARGSLRAELSRARQEADLLRAQVQELEADLEKRPRNATVTIPKQTIAVNSPLQAEMIRLIAEEGLGRSWRIYDRVVEQALASSSKSAKTVMYKLIKRGLVTDYEQHGKPVRWANTAGGSSRLLVLTEAARIWYRQTYDKEPVESEIAIAAREHRSVAHGVAILEARDHLRAAGYDVESEPEPILADPTQRWGRRTEPDLGIIIDGVCWPVEVQREVSRRVIQKWDKALRLTGRLALVLFNQHKREKQTRFLRQAARAGELPRNFMILLSSLEEMERSGWTWMELSTQ